MELAQIGGEGYRTKSWEMFAWPGTPRMDFVIILCDVAASRPQPKFPGKPISVYWPTPDPEAVKGTPEEVRQAFGAVFQLLNGRIQRMVALPGAERGKDELGKELERMVRSARRLAEDELMGGAELATGAEAERSGEAVVSGDLIPA
jgi:arsenate reductase